MAAWGGSAGGYYVAMVCLTANVPELEDFSLGNPGVPCHVQAGVDWFGPTDFLKMDEQLAESGLGSPITAKHTHRNPGTWAPRLPTYPTRCGAPTH